MAASSIIPFSEIQGLKAMLSITAFKSSSSASGVREYLENGVLSDSKGAEDYYLENGQSPTEMIGGALERLGVSPEHDSLTFEQLFRGQDKEGNPLTEGKSDTRRPGWDLTFSAPKSVSVAWAVADEGLQRQIETAHDHAVKEAMGYLETQVNTVSVGRGSRSANGTMKVQMEKAKIASSLFRHGTSREQDPAIHTHAVLFNLVVRSDGKIMSLNSSEFHKRKKEIGAIYRSVLAHNLQEIGFSVERDGFSFKLTGISQSVEKHFSRRREQIEQFMKSNGTNSAKASDVAALITREGKLEQPPEVLKQEWRDRASTYELTPSKIKDLLTGQEKEGMTLFDSLLDQMTQHRSAFTDFNAKEVIATEAQGRLNVKEIVAFTERFFSDENRNLIHLEKNGERFYTSKAMYDLERDMISKANDLKNITHHKVSAATVDKALTRFTKKNGFSLNHDQQEAVRHITQCSEGIALVQGSAGTGKSTALEVAKMAWEKRGFRVRGAALSGKAASGLSEAGIESTTIASLMLKNQEQKSGMGLTKAASDPIKKNDVVVIDEAGMVDSRTVHSLITYALEAKAKLVLIGDTKQLQAIEAGGAFNAIENYAQIKIHSLDKIIRQKTAVTKSLVKHTLNKDGVQALQTLRDSKHLHVTEDHKEAITMTVSHWMKHYDPSKISSSLMIANTHEEIKVLNQEARSALIENGMLSKNLSVESEVSDKKGISLGNRTLTEGERIIFKKNDKKLGIMNGDLGTITRIDVPLSGGYKISANKENGSKVVFNTKEYNTLDHGYAITTHASQGATIDHASILAGGGVQDFHSTYVQFSRVKKEIDVSVSKGELTANMMDIQPTENMKSLATALAEKNNLEDPSTDNCTFIEVRDFLNLYAKKTIGVKSGNEFDEIKELLRAMTKENIKDTTLDYQKASAQPPTEHIKADQPHIQDNWIVSEDKGPVPLSSETSRHSATKNKVSVHPQKTFWDKDVVLNSVMNNPQQYIEAFISESENTKLSKPGRLMVWGKKGSVKLVTDPGSRYFGMISDFERGYSGNLINYVSEMSGQNWQSTLDTMAKQSGLDPERDGKNQTFLTPEQEEKIKAEQAKAKQREAETKAKKIKHAQRIWNRSESVKGTLAERYLKEVRGVSHDLASANIRFQKDSPDTIRDDNGQVIERVTRPALIIGATNDKGHITAIQQIYLDPKTAEKHPDAQVAKRTIGAVQGAAALIHKGGSNKVIFAEGPETGASLAAAKPDANIYVSLGNNRNFGNLDYLASQHGTKEVHFAADNDGGIHTGSYKGLKSAAEQLDQKGVAVQVAMPKLLSGREKTDYNDTLKEKGAAAIRESLDRAKPMLNEKQIQVSQGVER